ncbi:MAG: tetratricopeptide repeat protein [Candidatus Riflebacteria bacterium]|nr:tetratricopeptide repeat protein [Candidatus Riflebacteria bacterium]
MKGFHLLSNILQAEPIHIPALLSRGEILYNHRRFRLARNDFLAVLREDPDNERACLFLGLISGIYGQMEEGKGYFERALARAPHDLSVRWLVADACLALGQFAAALCHFQRVLDATPSDTRTICGMGYCHFHQGALDTAMDCFRRAATVDPGCSQAHLEAAKVALLKGMTNHARYYLRRVLALEPASKEGLTTLAFLLHYTGSPGEAQSTVRRVLRQDPTYLPALLLLGGLEVLGRARGNEGLSRAARSLTPSDLRSLPFVRSSHRTYSRFIWLPLEPPEPYRTRGDAVEPFDSVGGVCHSGLQPPDRSRQD